MFLCYGYVYHSDVISLKQTTEAYSSEMIVKPEEYFVIKWYSKAFFWQQQVMESAVDFDARDIAAKE